MPGEMSWLGLGLGQEGPEWQPGAWAWFQGDMQPQEAFAAENGLLSNGAWLFLPAACFQSSPECSAIKAGETFLPHSLARTVAAKPW